MESGVNSIFYHLYFRLSFILCEEGSTDMRNKEKTGDMLRDCTGAGRKFMQPSLKVLSHVSKI